MSKRRNEFLAQIRRQGQEFANGEVVQITRDLGSYKRGDLLVVLYSSLQKEGASGESSPNRPWSVNSYSCLGLTGGVAWLSLDDIERYEPSGDDE